MDKTTKPINDQKKSQEREVSPSTVIIVVQANNKKPPFGYGELIALGMFILTLIKFLLQQFLTYIL